MSRRSSFLVHLTVAAAVAVTTLGAAQESGSAARTDGTAVALQPLAQQVRRLELALHYLGESLSPDTHARLNDAIGVSDERAAVAAIAQILAPRVLFEVTINPESRVSVRQGDAPPRLVEQGTRLFLVKIVNQAGVTAPLTVSSPQSGRTSISSWTGNNASEPPLELTPKEAQARWMDVALYTKAPLAPRLSGLPLEYALLQVYSRDAGQRAAQFSFSVGQGTQDVGFRSDALVTFTAAPATLVTLNVRDERGGPSVASVLVRDDVGRTYPDVSKRLAPDFPFQPQVYRGDGESLDLPPGDYDVTYTRGPEYLTGRTSLHVADTPVDLSLRLERWIDPEARGWYSADHHVHAAGCSHYQNPTLGVGPEPMFRQLEGEALNIGAVLTWGPCYYHQKENFSGQDHPLSTADRLMHYDLEVSGFPSSHAGHAVLLGLREQDYPGAARIEGWPSWILPILRWAKAQGATTGFAHSGFGLAISGRDLPSDEMPAFDSIGANEYIVDVTHENAVDFISAVDTPPMWELNIWYHTLDVGFRTRIAGETDFPCIYDDRVGGGRTYAHLSRLTYSDFLDAVRAGRSYVSDGRSHLMDFRVGSVGVGEQGSELRLGGPQHVQVHLVAAARLDPLPDDRPHAIAPSGVVDFPELEAMQPFWHLERARIAGTRSVPVEIVVNGHVVATQPFVADGTPRELTFDVAVERSSWVAARILPSSHTNPVFVIVGGRPIRASRASAQWCLRAVDQCWTQKAPQIRESERAAAADAYEHARRVYRERLAETTLP